MGPAVDIIAQTARDNDIDLIVMGTQRADGAKTWLGSVTTDTVVNEGIQQYLDQCQAELLVMIPQHRSFLDSLLRSSHTKQMVFHTRKPLLAVRG